MISTTCHKSVDLSLQPTMSPATAPLVDGMGTVPAAQQSAREMKEAVVDMENAAAQQEDAWLASLINQRRDAIELSEAIFEARIQAERDQEQQRLQDLLRRMMDGLNDSDETTRPTAQPAC